MPTQGQQELLDLFKTKGPLIQTHEFVTASGKSFTTVWRQLLGLEFQGRLIHDEYDGDGHPISHQKNHWWAEREDFH